MREALLEKQADIAQGNYQDSLIEEVKERDKYFEIQHRGGWCLTLDKKYKITPKVGDTLRTYGRGIGYSVTGLEINGKEIYYRTKEDEALAHAEYVAKKKLHDLRTFRRVRAKLDRQYARLPLQFQRRIDKFRRTNPEFRWTFEAYEMSVCVDAVRIYNKLKTQEEIAAFADMTWAEQSKLVPHLFKGHSGNSFGMAVSLAWEYAANKESVVLMHGALVALVGCQEYGCPHPET